MRPKGLVLFLVLLLSVSQAIGAPPGSISSLPKDSAPDPIDQMEATLDQVHPILNNIDPKLDGFDFKKIVMAYLEGAYEIGYAQQVTRGLHPQILATHFFAQPVAGYNPTEAAALRDKFMEWAKLMEGAKPSVESKVRLEQFKAEAFGERTKSFLKKLESPGFLHEYMNSRENAVNKLEVALNAFRKNGRVITAIRRGVR